jgi:PhnB protein
MSPEIQPELWVSDAPAAVAFYERALGATVVHRVDGPDEHDLIAQLDAGGARFWVSNGSDAMGRFTPDAIGGATGRLLLVADDPDAMAAAAAAAGATVTSAVQEEHGWRLGRFTDPFGHDWEVGHPVGEWPP